MAWPVRYFNMSFDISRSPGQDGPVIIEFTNPYVQEVQDDLGNLHSDTTGEEERRHESPIVELDQPPEQARGRSNAPSPPVAGPSGQDEFFPAQVASDETELREITPEQVSGRQYRKMRDSDFRVTWFSSSTVHQIPAPPVLPVNKRVRMDDLYIHWYGVHVEGAPAKFQAWICDGTEPVVWTSIKQGHKRLLSGQEKDRYFIMTMQSKKPSWALQTTVSRLYSHLMD